MNANATTAKITANRFVVAFALIAAVGAAQAGNLVDIDVLDRHNGSTLPEYFHRGQQYVPGIAGNEFSVVLRNRSNERVMAVLSVDGVNAISGQTAAAQQAGYVLNPYETVTIDGWRKSTRHTAAFYFTELPDSYAARTGRPNNVGVIGVAVFREKDYPQIPRWSEGRRYGQSDAPVWDKSAPAPYSRDRDQELAERQAESGRADEYRSAVPAPAAPSSSAGSSGLAKRSQPTESLGTGHGRPEFNPVEYTQFTKRSSRPDEVVSVYYDSWNNLAAAGIVPRGYSYRSRPQAFPNSGFVPDPY
jgi:hypothetical protein